MAQKALVVGVGGARAFKFKFKFGACQGLSSAVVLPRAPDVDSSESAAVVWTRMVGLGRYTGSICNCSGRGCGGNSSDLELQVVSLVRSLSLTGGAGRRVRSGATGTAWPGPGASVTGLVAPTGSGSGPLAGSAQHGRLTSGTGL